VRRYEDGFGNVAHLVTSMRPHTFLQLSVESEVETHLTDPFASEMIYRDFTYQPGVTDVTTSVAQVVEGRQGVRRYRSRLP